MLPRYKFLSLLIATSALSLAVSAQQTAQPKPQTARQALLEMVTKGGNAVQRHLTVEVQNLLKGKKAADLAMLTFKPEGAIEVFESGEVLFSYNDAAQHTKYEVHVDNDDLAGDEDSLLLSIHSFRDGKEQDNEWSFMSPHITVSMKLQENIWRVDKLSVGAEFPIGDPKFFESTFMKMANGEAAGAHLSVLGPGARNLDAPAPMKRPEQTVRMLGFAETAFARQHPDVGFTCTLSDLAEWSKMTGVDQQVLTGNYNGYRFVLGGCEGKPAGSFQIIAEPLLGGKGAKAFCTDATGNLRVDDTGRGATCLASGKVDNRQTDGDAEINWSPISSSEPKK